MSVNDTASVVRRIGCAVGSSRTVIIAAFIGAHCGPTFGLIKFRSLCKIPFAPVDANGILMCGDVF
jgi:hypothetical protein